MQEPSNMEDQTKETTRQMGVVMLILLTCLNRAGLVEATPRSSSCPVNCRCALLRNPTTGIYVVCEGISLDDQWFPIIQSPDVKWLSLSCILDFRGELNRRWFSGMPELLEITITSCNIQHIPSDVFTDLYRLQNLTINGSYLNTVISPRWLQPLNNSLKILNLSFNNLRRFPHRQFCGLLQLETLILKGNDLRNSDELGITCDTGDIDPVACQPCLPNITYLDLSLNRIPAINVNFRLDLPLLKTLNLSYSSLMAIPQLDAILTDSMEVLDLSDNKLSSMFIHDCNASQMATLRLQNNGLKDLSSGLFDCFQKLQYLDLSGNSVPEVILHRTGVFNLENLKWLSLNNNTVTSIQFGMFIKMTHLLEFSCSNCAVRSIENAAFIHLTSLQSLKLNGNQIKAIQSNVFKNLWNLITLDLSENQIVTFEKNIGLFRLRHLYLGKNNLKSIPDFSSPWPNLIVLDLPGNEINDIQPEKLSGLGNLLALRISFNNFTSIPGGALRSLKSLRILNLRANAIQSIEYSAFQGLTSLTHLRLDYNRIEDVDIYLIPLKALQRLYMSGNLVQTIRRSVLPEQLQYIDLSHNRVKLIESKVFFNLKELLAVNLTYNQFDHIAQTSLWVSPYTWLRPHIFLQGNYLECDCAMEWLRTVNSPTIPSFRMPLVPDLDLVGCEYHVTGSRLFLTSRSPSDFICTYTSSCICHCCNETNCSCGTYCYEECTCFRNQDYSINTMICTSRNLTSPISGRRPSSARKLLFDNNTFTSLIASDFDFPHTTTLLLNNSHITSIEPFAFRHMTAIQELHLHDNDIKVVKKQAFRNISTLERLYFHNNKIEKVESNAFQDLTSLKTLWFHQNSLQHIDLSLFNGLELLLELTLYGNPWQCDCQFGPEFQKWLLAHSSSIVNPWQIFCTSYPPSSALQEKNSSISYGDSKSTVIVINSMNDTQEPWPLMDLNFSICNVLRIIEERQRDMIEGVVSLAVIFVVLVAFSLVLYHYRLLIQVWAYSRFGIRLRLHSEDEDNVDRPYDLFIAHADGDEDFVIDKLLPGLEHEEKTYKVCVEFRDWLPGESVTENIVASISQSKRTLLVVTNNYFQSQWCKYQFDTANYQVMKDKQLRLLILLYDEKLKNRIEPDLQLYVKTRNYLVFGEKWFWEKLRYYLPDNARPADTSDLTLLDVRRGRRGSQII